MYKFDFKYIKPKKRDFFIYSSKRNLKAVFIHNGENYDFVLIGPFYTSLRKP